MSLSKEAEISISASSRFPGFKFSPSDEELISYYLKKKVEGQENAVEVIAEVDITRFEPWDLPDKSMIKSDHEWLFFSSRGRKYPNGSQSRRATEMGYWKATGKERGVKSGSDVIGTKRTLVFHTGRAPRGERTEWIMHEYRMPGLDSLVVCRLRRKKDFRGSTSQNQEASSSKPPALKGSASESEFPSKKSNNNDDGQSSEHVCETSTSAEKVEDEEIQPESSSRPSVSHASVNPGKIGVEEIQIRVEEIQLESSNDPSLCGKTEDDCFADILNDNIIDLDDSLGSIRGRQSQVPMWRTFPSQGTANRRIRLRKLMPHVRDVSRTSSEKSRSQGDVSQHEECKLHPLGWSTKFSSRERWKLNQLCVGIVLITVAVVFVFLVWCTL